MDNKKILYSGGAIGCDKLWNDIAKERGYEIVNYYYEKKTPYGNTEISKADYALGVMNVNTVSTELKKIISRSTTFHKLARNWVVARDGDMLLAFGEVKSYNSRTVKGGTGWTVLLAILENKPIYLFNLKTKGWEKYNYDVKLFEPLSDDYVIDITDKNISGIGPRDLGNNKSLIISTIEKLFEQNNIPKIKREEDESSS